MVVRLNSWSELALDYIETGAALLRSSLALEAACSGMDRESVALINDLVDWLKVQDEGHPELPDSAIDENPTDWWFLNDRAETHRKVGEVLIADGIALADLAKDLLRDVDEIPDNWSQRNELLRKLRGYADEITGASDKAKRALMDGNYLNFKPGTEKLGPVVQFLNQEAAQMTAFLDQRES